MAIVRWSAAVRRIAPVSANKYWLCKAIRLINGAWSPALLHHNKVDSAATTTIDAAANRYRCVQDQAGEADDFRVACSIRPHKAFFSCTVSLRVLNSATTFRI